LDAVTPSGGVGVGATGATGGMYSTACLGKSLEKFAVICTLLGIGTCAVGTYPLTIEASISGEFVAIFFY
jgi:hypothetical protein